MRHMRRCGDWSSDVCSSDLCGMHMGTLRIPQMQKLSWDPLSDFTYIIGLSGYTFGVVVRSDSPFRPFRELLHWAKPNPGKLSYGPTGTGTSPHLLLAELPLTTGFPSLHLPLTRTAHPTHA